MNRPTARTRWIAYATALGAVLLGVGWADGQDEPSPSVSVATPRPTEAEAPREVAPREIDVSLLGKREVSASEKDLFPATSWVAKAQEEALRSAPPPAPAPRPRPQAPPLPFVYLGKMLDGSETIVFLVHGDRNLSVRTGETLIGAYLVERIDEQSMTLTYLPLKQAQTLAFSALVGQSIVQPAAQPIPVPPAPGRIQRPESEVASGQR
jgi:hypothetical protein